MAISLVTFETPILENILLGICHVVVITGGSP